MFEINSPKTATDLVAALGKLHLEIGEFVEGFSTKGFLAPQGENWSPEGHLRHLVKSVRAVTAGMKAPRLLLGLRFGVSPEGSRSFGEIREIYLEALAAGGRAGRFAPSKGAVDMPPEEWRQLVMTRWESAGRELNTTLCRWPERGLDRYRLPHPLLGKLTVREMLFFTLYHNAYHATRVHERATGVT